MLYEEQRYLHRGRFAESRFERDCLTEYAEIFRTVCLDAGYYRFPSPEYIRGLCAQVPDGFKFGLKVTDEITARTFPNLPRHGAKAGEKNVHFLDADLFAKAFLSSCAPCRDKIGVLIFEFSHLHPRDFERGRDFVEALGTFLSRLPGGWQYGVEIRNQNLLQPEYFDMLRTCGVAHVYNNWTKMPSVADQMRIPGSLTNDEFTAARFLLRPGRTYEQAVEAFSPYEQTREINEEARRAATELALMRLKAREEHRTRPSFVFINNRLEGNALLTIVAILQNLGLLSEFLPHHTSTSPENPATERSDAN
jgi:uncharacterized protein YecE (DUF72 family)